MKRHLDGSQIAATLRLVVVGLSLRYVVCEKAPDDPINANSCNAEKLAMFPNGWPKILDSQIYWFGPNNQAEPATGGQSQFYDPNRNTVIFIDGFNGLYHVDSCHRMTTRCVPLANCEVGSDLFAEPWIKKGYNFGVFFWDQFADEDCYYEAELKVWGYRWTPEKKKYKEQHLHWTSYDNITKKKEKRLYMGNETSVAEYCASSMRSAMPTRGRETSLQIVGFSLGAQLAAACADVMYQEQPTHQANPTRVVLLEPALSAHFKPWAVRPFYPCRPLVGKSHQAVTWTADAIERLWNQYQVPLVLWKSSGMTRRGTIANVAFDPGVELDVLGTLTRFQPNGVCGVSFNYPCNHDVIVPFYFFSMRDAPRTPTLENAGIQSGLCRLPGPNCTDAEIRDMVKQRRAQLAANHGQQRLWYQVKGQGTWDLSDDVFRWQISPDSPVPIPASGLFRLEGFRIRDVSSSSVVAFILAIFALTGTMAFAIRRRHVHRFRSSSTDCEDEENLADISDRAEE